MIILIREMMMTLNEALDGISENLVYVLQKLLEVEESENLSASDSVTLQTTKDRIVGISKLIVSISDNKNRLNKDYIIYEVKMAQSFCQKAIFNLNKIEERTRLF